MVAIFRWLSREIDFAKISIKWTTISQVDQLSLRFEGDWKNILENFKIIFVQIIVILGLLKHISVETSGWSNTIPDLGSKWGKESWPNPTPPAPHPIHYTTTPQYINQSTQHQRHTPNRTNKGEIFYRYFANRSWTNLFQDEHSWILFRVDCGTKWKDGILTQPNSTRTPPDSLHNLTSAHQQVYTRSAAPTTQPNVQTTAPRPQPNQQRWDIWFKVWKFARFV